MTPRPTLTLPDLDRIRRTPGASVLLYLTDRCPVGCSHCSVSALPRAGRPADLALLGRLLDGLAGREGLRAVAVSGGEPFAERQALELVLARLADGAGKSVVLHTSGNWAGPAAPPAWIARVLRRTATVVLGVDPHHRARLGADRLPRAVAAVARAGAHLVLQVIDLPGARDRAETDLRAELGEDWRDLADIRLVPPLPLGRGAGVFPAGPPRPAPEFGPCLPACAPTVRYDGTVTGCCNESVVTGGGPAALRRNATDGPGLDAALDAFARSPLLRLLARLGPGPLAGLPGFEALDAPVHRSVCDACWAAHDAADRSALAAVLLDSLASAA